MSDGELDLCSGSRAPRDVGEMDALLRRVPEVALLPELVNARFDIGVRVPASPISHAVRITELADAAYLERVREALSELLARAKRESNGGLTFVAASLMHFVTSLPPERHPLIVALYFLSLGGTDPGTEDPAELARQMDEYESDLPPWHPPT